MKKNLKFIAKQKACFINSFFAVVPLSSHYPFGAGTNPIDSLAEGVQYLVRPTFTLATLSLTIYFVYGAFKFLSSGGDKEAIATARGMILHAIIGFILLMALFLVMQYLPEALRLKGFKIIQ